MQDVEVEPTDLTYDVQNSDMQSHDDCSDGSVNNEDILQPIGSAEATIETLPQEFLQGMDSAIYQDDFALVHQPRGRDRPSFPAKNVRGMAAMVIVHSENTIEVFGTLRGTTPAPFVKLAFHLESQWGGFSLRIKRSNGQMVVWKAFPSSFKRDRTNRCKPAFEINLGRNAKYVPVGQEHWKTLVHKTFSSKHILNSWMGTRIPYHKLLLLMNQPGVELRHTNSNKSRTIISEERIWILQMRSSPVS